MPSCLKIHSILQFETSEKKTFCTMECFSILHFVCIYKCSSNHVEYAINYRGIKMKLKNSLLGLGGM